MVDRVLSAAESERVLVAPVGTAYFLYRNVAGIVTKDVDLVIHGEGLEPVGLAVLKRIGETLGRTEISEDEALVRVTVGAGDDAEVIELLRGRARRSKGFLPRRLLEEAAHAAERRGRLLLYPLEYVLVLKADAAVDRQLRADRDSHRAEENVKRATAFRADVFNEVNRAMLQDGLDAARLQSAVSHLKKSRQEGVIRLLQAAGAPFDW
jgi:hypothetical protein